ncbi:MAG: hypothetical protein ACE5IQ_02075 [Candidatus Methylomirabilales bacterium]
MKRIAAILLGLLLVTQSTVLWAESDPHESTFEQVGLGTGSVVGSVVYFPLKTTFCLLGGVGSIYTRIFVGPRATHELVSLTCRGTWAITPATLKGQESVTFVGDVPPFEDDMPPEEGY